MSASPCGAGAAPISDESLIRQYEAVRCGLRTRWRLWLETELRRRVKARHQVEWGSIRYTWDPRCKDMERADRDAPRRPTLRADRGGRVYREVFPDTRCGGGEGGGE